MSKKNLLLLLCPGFIFLVIAIAAFMFSQQSFRYHEAVQERESQQKFDRFVENVQTGKWQLTSEKWLEAMRLERKQTESERRINLASAGTMRSGVWFILLGLAVQTLVVFAVRKEMRKP